MLRKMPSQSRLTSKEGFASFFLRKKEQKNERFEGKDSERIDLTGRKS